MYLYKFSKSKYGLFKQKSRMRCLKDEGIEIIRFGAKFFASPTGSRYLKEIKTGTNDENYWPSRQTSNFSEMANSHFN